MERQSPQRRAAAGACEYASVPSPVDHPLEVEVVQSPYDVTEVPSGHVRFEGFTVLLLRQHRSQHHVFLDQVEAVALGIVDHLVQADNVAVLQALHHLAEFTEQGLLQVLLLFPESFVLFAKRQQLRLEGASLLRNRCVFYFVGLLLLLQFVEGVADLPLQAANLLLALDEARVLLQLDFFEVLQLERELPLLLRLSGPLLLTLRLQRCRFAEFCPQLVRLRAVRLARLVGAQELPLEFCRS